MASSPEKEGKKSRRDLLKFFAFLIVLIGAIVVLRSGLTGIEWEPGALRAWFERSGNLTPILFFLLLPFLVNLSIPYTLLSIVAGMIFGLKTALILVLPATVLSHALGYAVSAWFLRETVRKMLDRMNLLRSGSNGCPPGSSRSRSASRPSRSECRTTCWDWPGSPSCLT